jgi:hypothetical protein
MVSTGRAAYIRDPCSGQKLFDRHRGLGSSKLELEFGLPGEVDVIGIAVKDMRQEADVSSSRG